ncbi:MAG: DUF2341 domain-containing protein [Chloroflexota bacterium]|nr:DUF2341 domain-containing protein [Chloroflexota bacterium]
MRWNKQQGFTILEAIIGIGIIALITPALTTGISQTAGVSEDTSAALETSSSISQAAESITADCNDVEIYLDVSDETYVTLIPDATDMDYGAFVETNDSGEVVSYVRYYYADGNLMRINSEGDDGPDVIATGIAESDDIIFNLSDGTVQVTMTVTNGDTIRQETFQATLEGFDGFKHRIPVTLSYSGGADLLNNKVLITLDRDEFDYSHINGEGVDIRFPIEYTLHELQLTIPGEPESDPTNYVAKVLITDETVLSHIAHGNDLRFYDDQCSSPYGEGGFDEGDGALGYWIEELTEDQLVVWVCAYAVPEEGIDIYMYYGNTFAPPKSDASILYDNYWDFATLEGWKAEDGKWDVKDGWLRSNSANGRIIYTTDVVTSVGQAYSAIIISPSPAATDRQGIIFAYQDDHHYYEASVKGDDNLQLIVASYEQNGNGQGADKVTVVAEVALSEGMDAETWYLLKVEWVDAESVNVSLEELDGTVLGTISHDGSGDDTDLNPDITSGYLGVRGNREGGLDDLRVIVEDPDAEDAFTPEAVPGTEVQCATSSSSSSRSEVMFSYSVGAWNSDGESQVWLELPYIPPTDTTLYMYYGNSDVSNGYSDLSDTAAEGVAVSLGTEESM